MRKTFRALLLTTALLPFALHGAIQAEAPVKILSIDKKHPGQQEEKTRILSETKALFALDPASMPAHPSAAAYPGVSAVSAKAITQEFNLEHKQASEKWQMLSKRHNYSGESGPTWYSTGFYAAPGTVVTISSAELVGKNATIRVGCHSDSLEHSQAKTWKRIPIIANNFKITGDSTSVANPFGGLIYITVPIGEADFSAKIKIENAIPAPLYQFGKTTAEEWTAMKNSESPWGEIGSDRVILSMPTSALRTIKDPEECLKVWNKILDTERELANHSWERYRPFRIVPDIQPSAGYMHSSYPIVASDDGGPTGAIAVMCDPTLLTKPSNGGANWGYFHEIGHNYQNLDWVWGGTTEVSVNFFSLYCFDKVVGSREGAHYGVSPKETQRMMTEYFKEPDYKKWTSSPFLALCTFRQLQDEFGWETFRKVFSEYLELTQSERPKGDQAKRDMFVVKFSKAAGKNIAPFFKAWQIPVSDEASDSVKELPEWMPKDFPPTAK